MSDSKEPEKTSEKNKIERNIETVGLVLILSAFAGSIAFLAMWSTDGHSYSLHSLFIVMWLINVVVGVIMTPMTKKGSTANNIVTVNIVLGSIFTIVGVVLIIIILMLTA